MRKFVIAFIVLVLLSTAAIVLIWRDHSQPSVGKLLPAEPLLYARVVRLEENTAHLAKTQFWQKLSRIDYRKVLEKAYASPQVLRVYDQITALVSSPENRHFVNALLGKEFAVAAYPVELKAFTPAALREIASSVVVVAKVKPEIRLMGLLSRQLFRDQEGIDVREKTVGKHKIMLFYFRDSRLTLAAVRLGNYLVFGVEEASIQRCLETVDGQRTPLSADAPYLDVRQGFQPDADAQAYLNISLWAKGLQKQLERFISESSGGEEWQARAMESIQKMKSFSSVGYSVRFGDLNRAQAKIRLNPQMMDSDLLQLYACKARINESQGFVPADVLAYHWNGCFDKDVFWKKRPAADETEEKEDGGANGKKKNLREQIIGGLQDKLAKAVEKEILPLIGHELGAYVKEIDTKGLFPFPMMVFFVQVNDMSAASDMLDNFVNESGLNVDDEFYQARRIRTLKIPLLTTFSPAYVFLDDYLMIATNPVLLKEVVDIRSQGLAGLGGDPAYQALGGGPGTTGNVLFFVRPGSLLRQVRPLVNWGNEWADMQSGSQAGQEDKLKELRQDIALKEESLKEFRARMSALKAPAPAEEGQAEKNSAVADSMKMVDDIRNLEQSLGELKEDEARLAQEIERDQQQAQARLASRRALTNDLVFPLFDAFSAVEAFFSKTAVTDGMIEAVAAWRLK